MEDEKKNVVEEAYEVLERMTNVYGCRQNLNDLAKKMSCMHRTLVQSFASGFVIAFVREMAKMKREGRFDARNSATCEACEAMSKALDEKYGTTEDETIQFSCI